VKTRLVLACVVAGITASTFSGATATADQFSGTIGITPGVVEPGYEVELNATCGDPKATTAPVSSDVLEPVILTARETIPDHDSRWVLTARARVKADAVPGGWPVSFTCGTETVTGYLIVAGRDDVVRPSISVEPKKGVAGTKVEIEVICVERQPVTSAALTIGSTTELPGGGEGRPYFEVAGKVKNVKPGVYRVSTKCGGEPISTSFTVLPSANSPQPAQVPVKPKRAPETGDA
jgi:hypothetical protein